MRDIAIIFLALESIVILAFMGILIWQIYKLARMLQTEVLPMMRDVQDTLSTVRGTTNFMSEHVVSPVMRTNSRLAGWRRTASVLMGDIPMQRGQGSATAAATPPPAPPSAAPSQPPPVN
ncbi:MAG: hypothetical protein IPK16_23085 [Anaerolineales bacterium]|nr:hypothetical protein [Anaerolineales bacterium]